MKDQILQGYLKNFTEQYEFTASEESEQFEYFVNNIIISKQYPREFEIQAISTGGSDDTGFDGIAIIVNNNIISTVEEVEYILKNVKNNRLNLNVSFVFIQSKLTDSFKSADIGNSVFGMRNFFDNDSSIPENEFIKKFRKIKDLIYEESFYFENNPTIDFYYVTTGKWEEPPQITGKVAKEKQGLEETNLFSKVNIHFIDAQKLRELYKEISKKTVKEINFPNKTTLPNIKNVTQSFVGSLEVNEFLNLISDSDGNLQKNLFEDNIRYFQGDNKVNREIENTINDEELQAALVILNNGITIIAQKIDLTGNKVKLTDFQIVNGCQSSHILYNNKDKFKDKTTNIVVKLIETTNQELITKIIKATNKQTPITDEAFESLSPFHKDLEEFYKVKSKEIIDGKPIFYERRSKQYDGDSSVTQSQIITLTAQIKSYVSTELEQPHSTHRYYGELLESNKKRIFLSNQSCDKYYISGLLLNRLEFVFNRKILDSFFRKFKFQIIYITYEYLKELRKGDKKFTYEYIIKNYQLSNYTDIFKGACQIIQFCLNKSTLRPHEALRSKEFTELLKNKIYSEFNKK